MSPCYQEEQLALLRVCSWLSIHLPLPLHSLTLLLLLSPSLLPYCHSLIYSLLLLSPSLLPRCYSLSIFSRSLSSIDSFPLSVSLYIYIGMAESISFNVSSIVQPSPIPPSTTLDSYTTRKSTRSRSKTRGGGGGGKRAVDIMMMSPETEYAEYSATCRVVTYPHTHTHTCTLTHSHSHTHTHTHTCTHTHTHTNPTFINTHTHSFTHTLAQAKEVREVESESEALV